MLNSGNDTHVKNLRQLGGATPFPVTDTVHEGHYRTYIDMKQQVGKIEIDKNCPSLLRTWRTYDKGCKYVFLSKADEERHMKLCHYDEIRKERRVEQQRKQRAATDERRAKKSKK